MKVRWMLSDLVLGKDVALEVISVVSVYQVCKDQPCQHTKTAMFFTFYPTQAEIHRELSKVYRMKSSPSEQRIMILGVICTEMVDFCKPGHIHTSVYIRMPSSYNVVICKGTHCSMSHENLQLSHKNH